MSNYMQFGFGVNDSSIGKRGKLLKLETNETARISLLWWPGLETGNLDLTGTPVMRAALRSYIKGIGNVINQGPEYTRLAGEDPKKRIATIVVKWPVRNGRLDAEALKEGQYQVMYWVFDEGKYEEIKPIHLEWGLGSVDLMIKCSDAGFQKMAFSPTRESVLATIVAKGNDHPLFRSLIENAQALLPGINSELGKEMSIEDIRERLSNPQNGGRTSGGPAVATSAAADVASALEALDL